MQLMHRTVDPLNLERANPAIHAYLAASKKKDIALNLVKDLRQKAKIDYVGGAIDTAPPPACRHSAGCRGGGREV